MQQKRMLLESRCTLETILHQTLLTPNLLLHRLQTCAVPIKHMIEWVFQGMNFLVPEQPNSEHEVPYSVQTNLLVKT